MSSPAPEAAPETAPKADPGPNPPLAPRATTTASGKGWMKAMRRDLGIALLVPVGGIAVAILIGILGFGGVGQGLALAACFGGMLLFFLTMVRGLSYVVRGLLDRKGTTASDWGAAALGTIFGAGGVVFSMFLASMFVRGRQLRRGRRVLLADVRDGADWSHLPTSSSIPADVRGPLAAQWRENGRSEHASVAAFAQLTLDMIALGAPPSLLADAQRDALDEIRHAELCFSLARAIDGVAESPAAFPAAQKTRSLSSSRTVALARLAVESLLEGALLEGFSARTLARLAPLCTDPAAAALVRELAKDEARHAKHGWDVIAWCIAEGGANVAHAVRSAAWAIPAHASSSLPIAARDGTWEPYGIPGEALEREAYEETRAQVLRCVAALSPRRAAA